MSKLKFATEVKVDLLDCCSHPYFGVDEKYFDAQSCKFEIDRNEINKFIAAFNAENLHFDDRKYYGEPRDRISFTLENGEEIKFWFSRNYHKEQPVYGYIDGSGLSGKFSIFTNHIFMNSIFDLAKNYKIKDINQSKYCSTFLQ
ncbi:hypothetical protein [Collimonas pratensis]|nr:hypothetical protein [Collimonas pratensis]